VGDAAGGLDLGAFLAAYRADGQGKTAYHPRMMVALIMYCYAKGVRSSRAVEMATWDPAKVRPKSRNGDGREAVSGLFWSGI
jgi:hypothetical protein